MIISDLNYVETVDAKVEGGAFAFSTASAANLLGFAAASNNSTAGIFVANSNSAGLAAGLLNSATASGFAFSTI
jgi:hypothetical protein